MKSHSLNNTIVKTETNYRNVTKAKKRVNSEKNKQQNEKNIPPPIKIVIPSKIVDIISDKKNLKPHRTFDKCSLLYSRNNCRHIDKNK